jgi:hypothetical protein
MLKAIQKAVQKVGYWALHLVARTDNCLAALRAMLWAVQKAVLMAF